MLDARGFVAETNATHVFVVFNGEVSTSRTVACPEGITRIVVLELCRRTRSPTRSVIFSLTEVYRADEVFDRHDGRVGPGDEDRRSNHRHGDPGTHGRSARRLVPGVDGDRKGAGRGMIILGVGRHGALTHAGKFLIVMVSR